MFRGSELPRLLVLVVILAGGLVFVWQFAYSKNAERPPQPKLVAGDVRAPIKPETSAEFDGVTDKTKVGLRDTAAYVLLLDRARSTKSAELAKKCRLDVFFGHLWEHPKDYRGVPVHLLGTAFRIVQEPSKKSRSGWLYEAWIVTNDSSPNPYICIFEDAPRDLPLGDKLSERVEFNGYFLKLLAYQAHDKERAAPMLIGRLEWTPAPPESGFSGRLVQWMIAAVGTLFVIRFSSWMLGLRRSMRGQRDRSSARTRPTDLITPEELAGYLRTVEGEGEKPATDAEATPRAPTFDVAVQDGSGPGPA
jgi:hypothetical protein